jgi:hypothetical protein
MKSSKGVCRSVNIFWETSMESFHIRLPPVHHIDPWRDKGDADVTEMKSRLDHRHDS